MRELIVIFNSRIIADKFLQSNVFAKHVAKLVSRCPEILRGEMTLSRGLARQSARAANNDKRVLCHCCVANWTKPRAWFCGLSLGLAEVFTPKFRFIWVAEESYHVIWSGQSCFMTNGQRTEELSFADSHDECYLEFVLMFGLIRSQNKCGIYHFRIVSPLILQALQDVWYFLDLQTLHCPMTLPSALNMSYSQNIQNIPTYLW